jgi:glycosyltransferase involved in cell wall biosynthesis
VSQKRRVVVLVGSLAPYYVSLFRHLQDLVGDLQIFVSMMVEPDRQWRPEFSDLAVIVQKKWSFAARPRHDQGFTDLQWRHIPYDTLPLLFRRRPDVVVSLQIGFRTIQTALYRLLVPGSRLIVWTGLSEHTERTHPAWRRLQRRALLRAADAVSANGTSAVNYLRRLGVPRDKIFEFPYYAEIAPHLSLTLEREGPIARRLLYVGQLMERKGVRQFIEALSDWLRRHPGRRCELWIAGTGPLRRDLEQLTVPAELQLRILGNVPYEELPALYAQAGIFAFPTLADEWGVVVNEALAAGLPVLGSTYSQAVDELIEDGVHGWRFRPDHAEELYAAIDRALTTDDAGIAGMRRECRERICALTPEAGARRLAAAIESVCGH